MKLFILIISYKSLPKLEKCINSIGKNRKILIIENSNNFEIKRMIEKKFDNCNVTVNGKNLGYGAAANIGFSKIEDQFVLLLNTDTIIEENQIREIEKVGNIIYSPIPTIEKHSGGSVRCMIAEIF